MLYRFGDYELDDRFFLLRRAGESIEIEPKVFDVLLYLLHHRDRLVSKDELLDNLWPGQVVSETALTRCIVAARKAVGDDGGKQQIIKTQHGRGYRFVAPLTTTPPAASRQYPVVSRTEQSEVQSPASKGQGLESALADETLLARCQTLDAATPSVQRSWSSRSFVLGGLGLLVGLIVIVQYLSRPSLSTQSSVLVTQEAKPPLPLPDKPSIVVLPFVNMSEDPAQEYFSDGVTEELTSGLSRLSSLFVIDRHSAFTYKDKAVKVQEVSKELGVRYVLEGSVRRAKEQVRVTA
jgi:TolB-like protein/DNA-binding winged helix-turn-helix (wHTH) protein